MSFELVVPSQGCTTEIKARGDMINLPEVWHHDSVSGFHLDHPTTVREQTRWHRPGRSLFPLINDKENAIIQSARAQASSMKKQSSTYNCNNQDLSLKWSYGGWLPNFHWNSFNSLKKKKKSFCERWIRICDNVLVMEREYRLHYCKTYNFNFHRFTTVSLYD